MPTKNLPRSLRGVKITLIITWLLYVPFALVLFAFSGMAYDSPEAASSLLAFILVLTINGIPLLLMIIALIFALKRNSIMIALSPPIILLCIWLFFFFVRFYTDSPNDSVSQPPRCTGYGYVYSALPDGTEKYVCIFGEFEY